MKVLILAMIILWSKVAFSQSVLLIKTKNMFYVIGTIDSTYLFENAKEGFFTYAECNGFRKILCCSGAESPYVFKDGWIFTLPIGTKLPSDYFLKIGAMDSTFYKMAETIYPINKKIVRSKTNDPMEVVFKYYQLEK